MRQMFPKTKYLVASCTTFPCLHALERKKKASPQSVLLLRGAMQLFQTKTRTSFFRLFLVLTRPLFSCFLFSFSFFSFSFRSRADTRRGLGSSHRQRHGSAGRVLTQPVTSQIGWSRLEIGGHVLWVQQSRLGCGGMHMRQMRSNVVHTRRMWWSRLRCGGHVL